MKKRKRKSTVRRTQGSNCVPWESNSAHTMIWCDPSNPRFCLLWMKVYTVALGCHFLPPDLEQANITPWLSMLQRTICDNTSPLQLGQWLGAQPAASLARSRANADEAKLWGREKLKGRPSLPDFVPPSYRWALQAGTHLRRVNCAETLHGLIQSQSGEW